MIRRLLTILLLIGMMATAFGQVAGFAVPDGSRHFVVLFDTSASMWSTPTKRRMLDTACNELADALFAGHGSLAGIPRFRAGKDLITIVHFGFDRQRDANRAYERLAMATLGEDYVRVATQTTLQLSRESFLEAFNVRQADKTNINALAWAIPLGLSRSKVGLGTSVQNTYVVLVNDSQLNDGSIALERLTLGHWLGPLGRANLAAAESEQAKYVRLVDDQGAPLPIVSEPFGRDRDMVTISAFRAQSIPSLNAAVAAQKFHPLEGIAANWVRRGSKTRLSVSFNVPAELRDRQAMLSARVGDKGAMTSVRLERSTTAEIDLSPDFADENAKIVLRPELTSSNEILGTQTFTIPYEELVHLPSSPESSAAKRKRTFFLFLVGAGVFWTLATVYRHGWLISHIRLRLPGYAPPFNLPPLSQMRNARFVVRVPSGNGETALVIIPPSGLIRRLFYKDSVASWDSNLYVGGHPQGETSANLGELRRPLELKWRDRPPEATVARVVIERKLPVASPHRLEILVRFAALPRLSGNRRILGEDSTS